MSKPKTDLDFLAIGETIVDFISTEAVNSLREATTFKRYLGGSPANIAVNISKMGGKAAIISKLGAGAFGQFLKKELDAHKVNTDYALIDNRVHSSVIFVSRTSGTPEHQDSRDSDYKLTPEEVSEEAIARARIIHTSTWPLSRQPSRSAIYKAFKLANEQDKITSFDPNYSPIIWPNYQEAQQVIQDFYQHIDITKASLDDAERFFGSDYQPETYIKMFHNLGPKMVIFTMGKEGSLISEDGHILGHLPVRPVEVADATGAGDAFWAGFLVALLDNHPLEKCLLFAREVVEMKLTTVGQLPTTIDRNTIYANLPEPATVIRPWRGTAS